MTFLGRTRIALAALIAAFAFVPVAHAQPDGFVVAAIQRAVKDAKTGQIVLGPSSPIYSGDRIVTDSVGNAQIKFRDDTKLVVGPNSALVIDAFIFNKNNSARKVSISALKGAFRFISGKSPKDVYRITTPTATIGIRG